MICDVCKKNQATSHVRSVVNGELTEMWLCSNCAKEMGYNSFFGDMASDFSSFLGSFLGDGLPSRTSATRCTKCGSSFAEIARSGKVGCPQCYTEFYNELLPSIRKIHGNTEHTGKTASMAGPKAQIAGKLEKTKEELAKAVKAQNFELAAKLRDEIKELEAGEENE